MELGKKIAATIDILADAVVFLGIMHFATFLIIAYSPIDSAILITLLQLLMLFAFLVKMYEIMPFENYVKFYILSLISSPILLIIFFECIAFIL